MCLVPLLLCNCSGKIPLRMGYNLFACRNMHLSLPWGMETDSKMRIFQCDEIVRHTIEMGMCCVDVPCSDSETCSLDGGVRSVPCCCYAM